MSLGHVCFADMLPSTPPASNQDVKSITTNIYANDDAIRQCGSLIRTSRDRSISPNSVNSSTPRYIRNMGFFRQLSRRFGLRSNDDLIYTAANDDDNQSSSTDSCSSTQAAAAAVLINKGREVQQQSLQTTDSHISGTSSETSSTMEDIEEPNQTESNEQQQAQQQKLELNKQLSYNSRASFSRLQRRSTSTIRKALAGFSLTTRSLSCSGAPPAQPRSESNTPSSASSTPIKSALKSSSNLELNKKTLTNHYTHQLTPAAALSGKPIKKVKPPPQRILRQPVSYTYLKGISGLPTQRVPRNSVCCQYARY